MLLHFVGLTSTMHHFRRKTSSSSTPTNGLPPTPTSPIQELIKSGLVATHSKVKDPKALAASTSAVAFSIGSPPHDPESSKELRWRTVYGAARIAVEVAKESSDMFLPLKAVVGALAVLIKHYDVSPRVLG